MPVFPSAVVDLKVMLLRSVQTSIFVPLVQPAMGGLLIILSKRQMPIQVAIVFTTKISYLFGSTQPFTSYESGDVLTPSPLSYAAI